MCEILAISANKPVGVTFSWAAFEERGSRNPDGWGYAFTTDNALERRRYARTLTHQDEDAGLVGAIESPVFLAHVRYRVQGPRTEESAQPFVDGAGDIAAVLTVSRGCRLTARYSDCVGDLREGSTGAELLFWLLVRGADEHGGLVPEMRQVVHHVFDPAQLHKRAQSSFVVTDGRTLIAFRHHKPLWWLTRAPPHEENVRLRNPNLPAYKADLLLEKSRDEVATVMATEKLSRGERWEALPERTLVAVRDGEEQWREAL